MSTKNNTIKLSFKNNNFDDLVTKLKDLSSLNPKIKIKIDSTNIFMYSLITATGTVQKTLGLKSFILNTADYIDGIDDDMNMELVILEGVKFVRQLQFIETEQPIKFDVITKKTSDDIDHVRSITITNKKLKIMSVGGELHVIKDVPLAIFEKMLDPSLRECYFTIHGEELADIKKMSAIFPETVINIEIRDGKVAFAEYGKWNVDICDIDYNQNKTITFLKKYLSNVNINEETLDVGIYKTYILITDNCSKLMLSFEQDFEN